MHYVDPLRKPYLNDRYSPVIEVRYFRLKDVNKKIFFSSLTQPERGRTGIKVLSSDSKCALKNK